MCAIDPVEIDQNWPNELKALFLIHKFRWLRSAELGHLIWPRSRNFDKYSQSLIKDLADRVDHKCVIVRALPGHKGNAVVLGAPGVRRLREVGIVAKTGKDWGTINKNKKWSPPQTWLHELVSNAALVDFCRLGYRVVTESQLRAAGYDTDKLPDGLVIDPKTEDVFWMETERAPKKGDDKRHLARALIKTNTGQAPKFGSYRANRSLVVYCDEFKDDRGYAIDHRASVIKAIEKLARADVKVTFGKLVMDNAASTRLILDEVMIASSKVTHRLAAWSTWVQSGHSDSYVLTVDRYYIEVAFDKGRNEWWYVIEDNYVLRNERDMRPKRLLEGFVETKAQALRTVAGHKVWWPQQMAKAMPTTQLK